jgi:hypothetical protein
MGLQRLAPLSAGERLGDGAVFSEGLLISVGALVQVRSLDLNFPSKTRQQVKGTIIKTGGRI